MFFYIEPFTLLSLVCLSVCPSGCAYGRKGKREDLGSTAERHTSAPFLGTSPTGLIECVYMRVHVRMHVGEERL